MLFVGGRLQLPRVGQDDGSIVEAFRHVVNHHIVHNTRAAVFLFHIEVIAAYLVIKHAFGDIQLGRLLPNGVDERPHLYLRLRQDIVLEEKSEYGNDAHEKYKRAHHMQQRDTGCLDGKQFEPLAQVAEGHERCQQDGKRQSQWHHGHGGIEEELQQDRYFQTFAHHFIDVLPQELHQHDEKADKEGHEKDRQEALQHEPI